MARNAEMFSSGTRQAFSVAPARSLMAGTIDSSRALSSARSGGVFRSLGWFFSCAATPMSPLLLDPLAVDGVRIGTLGARDYRFASHGDAVGRILIDQGFDRIADLRSCHFADE